MDQQSDILQRLEAMNSLYHRIIFFDRQTRDYRPGQRRRAIIKLNNELLPEIKESIRSLNLILNRIPHGQIIISSSPIKIEMIPDSCERIEFTILVNKMRETLDMPILTYQDLQIPPHPNDVYREALERIYGSRLTH